MSDKCFVDTNILIYAYDSSAVLKHQRASELLQQIWIAGNGAISTQVLQEFAFTVRRKPKRPLSSDDTVRVLRQYLHWHIVVNGPASVVNAIAIETRHRISFWDALIICAAQMANAVVLYSEDLSHGQVYDSVKVINPFR
jgi:predicted nucleic acid-binding protein